MFDSEYDKETIRRFNELRERCIDTADRIYLGKNYTKEELDYVLKRIWNIKDIKIEEVKDDVKVSLYCGKYKDRKLEDIAQRLKCYEFNYSEFNNIKEE